ncbi:MAG: peptidoglycan DD-metalloendopeptidase family protein, partial [Eubacteriaceae bacterium]|nr:peptidoglycan DD-metalloendopeptidase family protein [Eubacteriaceae bacterium]
MAFGFNPKLTEAERSDRMVRRQLRKLDRRQRLLDHALADRIRKENSALVASCREQGGLLDVPENRQEDRETSPSVFFRIRYFFSETASRIGSFFSANRKPLVFTAGSIAAILVFTLISGYLVCYDVHFNGNSLGTVTSLAAVDRALDRYQEDLVEEYDLPSIYFERTVTSSIVLRLSHKNVMDTDGVYEKLSSLEFPLFCRGAVITIDGTEAIKLASAADAQEAIQRFIGLFRSSPQGWFKLIDITELSTQEELGVKEKIIAIGSDYTVDEAVRYLCALAVNGLNNYDAPEGAKKVVDYSLEAGGSSNPSQETSRPGYANYDAENFFTSSGIPSTSLIFSADLTPKTAADDSLMLNLVAVEEVDYEITVPFEIKEYDSDYYYIGELFTTTTGSDGRKKVHSYVTSVNGIMVGEEIIEEQYIREPVTEMRAKGTRPLPEAYSEGRFVVPTTGLITDTSREGDSHAGFHAVDIANREGTGIYASDSGTVLKTEWGHFSWGNYIIIAHADGYQTMYAHLSY